MLFWPQILLCGLGCTKIVMLSCYRPRLLSFPVPQCSSRLQAHFLVRIRGESHALTFHKRYFIAYITCSHSLGDHVHAPMIGAVERALRRMCSTNHGSCPYDLSSLRHTLLLFFSQNMLLWPLILLYGLGCIKIVTVPASALFLSVFHRVRHVCRCTSWST